MVISFVTMENKTLDACTDGRIFGQPKHHRPVRSPACVPKDPLVIEFHRAHKCFFLSGKYSGKYTTRRIRTRPHPGFRGVFSTHTPVKTSMSALIPSLSRKLLLVYHRNIFGSSSKSSAIFCYLRTVLENVRQRPCDLRTIGRLSTRVFETRTATGSEMFSLFSLTQPHSQY